MKNPFVFALNLMQFFSLRFLVQSTDFTLVHSEDDISNFRVRSPGGCTYLFRPGYDLAKGGPSQCSCLESDPVTLGASFGQ